MSTDRQTYIVTFDSDGGEEWEGEADSFREAGQEAASVYGFKISEIDDIRIKGE